jgi:hypothetical protein
MRLNGGNEAFVGDMADERPLEPRGHGDSQERGDLYEDDLTEEHYPSPEKRDEAAATEVLDPDVGDDDEPVKPASKPQPPGS